MATVEVDGLRQFIKALKAKGVAIEDLKDAMHAVGELIARTARPLTNPKSSRLADSIRPTRQQNRAIVRAGGRAVPYAGNQHFGWPARGIAPKLYLYEAADRRRSEIVAKFDAAIKEAITKE